MNDYTMSDQQQKIVHFLDVETISAKLNSICKITQKHFSRKESILIAAPSQEAALYIDQLLWKQPEESFIPHIVVNIPTKELVAITVTDLNVNRARILINLRPDVPPRLDEYAIIYDLLDRTHPSKEALSRNRQSTYQSLNLRVEEFQLA